MVKERDRRFTLTIFINGYQLPDAYSIEDLQYFLWNSSPIEKLCGTIPVNRLGAKQPKPVKLKAIGINNLN